MVELLLLAAAVVDGSVMLMMTRRKKRPNWLHQRLFCHWLATACVEYLTLSSTVLDDGVP